MAIGAAARTLNVLYSVSMLGMTKAEAGFKRISNHIRGTENHLQGLSTTAIGIMGNFAALFTVARGFQSTVVAAADLEFQLARVRGITGASREELIRLKNAAIDLNLVTEFDPTQIIAVQQNLAQAGFTVERILKTTKGVLDLATASFNQITLREASDIVISAMQVFQKSAKETSEVIDKMTRATQMFRLQASDLRQSLALSGGSAKAMNQTLDETLVLLGALRNQGISASRAGTSLDNALRFVARNTADKKLADISLYL